MVSVPSTVLCPDKSTGWVLLTRACSSTTTTTTNKVWQPQRAARSKRPNTPSDGSKHNGFQTTNQAVLIPKHVSRQDRAHDQDTSIGCNGMANNDDYHGLEMYKNHAKDSTTEGYMQPDPTTMECGRINPSKSRQRSYRHRAHVMYF